MSAHLTDARLVGLVLVAVVLVLAATALAATLVDHASRLHRLHRRVDASAAALEHALARRRAAALAWCGRAGGGPEIDALALAAGAGRDESALTRALAVALPTPAALPAGAAAARGPVRVVAPPGLADLALACEAVVMARRFANDAAARAVAVRTKPLVRWTRLAGSAPMPATVEIDDEVPPALLAPGAWR